MKGIISCFVCGENHDYKISHQVLAFACPFLGGIFHFNFYTKEDIEKHKKEAEPKRRKGGFDP
mgnify:FL=1